MSKNKKKEAPEVKTYVTITGGVDVGQGNLKKGDFVSLTESKAKTLVNKVELAPTSLSIQAQIDSLKAVSKKALAGVAAFAAKQKSEETEAKKEEADKK